MSKMQRVASGTGRENVENRTHAAEHTAAAKRFAKALAAFVASRVPRLPNARDMVAQQVQQTSAAIGMQPRRVNDYKNGHTTTLPDIEYFRRFCLAARPHAPGELAAEILFGTASSADTLAEQVAVYVATELASTGDTLQGPDGEKMLAYVVASARDAVRRQEAKRELWHALAESVGDEGEVTYSDRAHALLEQLRGGADFSRSVSLEFLTTPSPATPKRRR